MNYIGVYSTAFSFLCSWPILMLTLAPLDRPHEMFMEVAGMSHLQVSCTFEIHHGNSKSKSTGSCCQIWQCRWSLLSATRLGYETDSITVELVLPGSAAEPLWDSNTAIKLEKTDMNVHVLLVEPRREEWNKTSNSDRMWIRWKFKMVPLSHNHSHLRISL